MKSSDSLFAIIKSLSAGEVRNFRKVASVFRDQSDVLKLFNFIISKDVWDDSLLQEIDKELVGNRGAQKKRDLKNVILKSLRSIKKYSDPYTQVINHLQDARNLCSRKLYKEAEKSLAKAEAIAIKREFFSLHIELLQVKMNTMAINIDKWGQDCDIMGEVRELERKREGLWNMKQLWFRLQSSWKENTFLTDSGKEELQSFLPVAYWDTASQPKSRRERFYFCWAKSYYFLLMNEVAVAAEAMKEVSIELRDLLNKEELVDALFHKCTCFQQTFEWEKVNNILQEAEVMIVAPPHIQDHFAVQKCNYFRLNCGLSAAHHMEDECLVNELLEEIDSFLKENELPTTMSQVLLGHSADVMIKYGMFHQAKQNLVKVLSLPKKDLRKDVAAQVRTLLPAVLFLLKEYDLFEAEVRASIRYFSGQNLISVQERIDFLKPMASMKNFDDKIERTKVFEELEKVVESIAPGYATPNSSLSTLTLEIREVLKKGSKEEVRKVSSMDLSLWILLNSMAGHFRAAA